MLSQRRDEKQLAQKPCFSSHPRVIATAVLSRCYKSARIVSANDYAAAIIRFRRNVDIMPRLLDAFSFP
jgi:hypothetical protein